MRKKFTLLIAACALLSFLTIPTGMWGQNPVNGGEMTRGTYTGTFIKCTGALTSGTYIIGVVENNTIYAINNTVGTSWIKYTDVTISSNQIVNPNENVVWTYDSETGYIKNVDNTNYIYWTSGNVGCCGPTAYAHNVTESSTSGVYTVTSRQTTSRILCRNTTSGYRYYTSSTGSQAICFFKLNDTPSGPTQLDTPDNFQATAGNEQATFTWNAVSNASGYTISYTYTGGTEQTETVNGGSTTSKTITGLNNGTEYTCKIMAVGDGTTYSDSEYSSTITVTPTNTLYTVTLNAGNGTVNGETTISWNVSMNNGDLPAAEAPCSTWNFGGWSTSLVDTQTTTAPTTFVPTHYVPTSNITLYAVYTKTEGGASFDGTTGGNFLIYADVSGTNYYATGTGQKINSTTTASEATTYTFEKPSGYGTDEFAIKTGSYYITYSSGTNLGTSTDPYKWTITNATAGAGTWRVLSGTNGRALIFQEGTVYKFGGYSTGNVPSNNNVSYYDIEIGGGTTTYYHNTPSCAAEQLAAPTVTLAAGIGSITPTWTAVNNASSYTLQYGTTINFAANTYWEITNATSGTAITEHITNGTVYYVRVKSIGDGTTYTDSDWSTVVNATPVAVTTPTFSVAGISTGTANEYVDVAEVTITAPDYTTHLIYYTTDGSEPDENDELYEGGTIDIITTGTTTIKAIAYDGDLNESEIGSITINVVATTPIATVYEAEDGDTYYITEGIVTYKRSGNNMFIEDDNAGILVYGTNSSCAVGDRVVIKGTKTTYQDKPELQNITILGKFSSGNTLPLNEISISDADDYMYRRVKYTQVLVGSTSDNLTTISQGTDNIGVYNMPSVTNVTDAGYYLKTITGIVAYYGGANQMYVASADDITSYTIDASSSNTALGTVTTSGYVVTATPASGVVYDNPAYVVVTDATDYDIDQTGDVFTIVTNGDMAIEIQFNTTAATHDVTFYVNGTADPTMAMEVLDGGELGTLPVATAPNGYAFMGWTESTISGVQAGAPTMVTSSTTVDDDMDLYAVFALAGEATTTYEKVAANITNIVEGTYLIAVNKVNSDNYNFADGSAGSGYAGVEATGVAVANSYLSTEIPDGAKEYTLSGNNTDGFSIHCSTGYLNGGSTKFSLSYGNSATETWTFSVKNDGFVLDGVTNESKMSCNSSTAASAIRNYASTGNYYDPLYFFKKNDVASYSNYCTTVTILSGDISGTKTGANSIDASLGATIKTGTTLTAAVLGNANPNALEIEDGGQLITDSKGVQATVVKHINKYNSLRDNYYLLASPIKGEIAATDVTDMLENTYDLYYFDADQETEEWQNYKVNTFAIANEKGYLYANSGDVDLEFSGELVPSNEGVTIPLTYAEENAPKFNGWNLVGNPFPCNATPTITDFYVISGTEVQATTYGTVAPCEAIFVKATAATRSVTFSKATTAGNNSNLLNISLSKDGANMDKAFVRFGQGEGLPKFMLNADNTKISLDQSGVEYAVVYSEAEAELPVNFKASENGSYTLSVEAKDVEMSYLHLIDNMTGADVDLLATPSYSFEARTTDYASRFRLVFSANNGSNENGNETFAYYNGSEWVISNMGDATLQVVDVMGRVLSSETVSGNANVSLNQTPGVYVIRLVNGDSVKTQKIVVR